MPGIPWVELVGDGQVLRPPHEDDARAALALLTEPDVVRWNPAPAVVDIASAAAWCRRGSDWSQATHATFSVHSATDGAFVGNVSRHNIDSELGTASIGSGSLPIGGGWVRQPQPCAQ